MVKSRVFLTMQGRRSMHVAENMISGDKEFVTVVPLEDGDSSSDLSSQCFRSGAKIPI
jgi:hypothetical protein